MKFYEINTNQTAGAVNNNQTWPPAKETAGIPGGSCTNDQPSHKERNISTMMFSPGEPEQVITDKSVPGIRTISVPSEFDTDWKEQNFIFLSAGSNKNELNEKDAEIDLLRSRIRFLEQFAPKDCYGAPNKKGEPKTQIRRGYFTARNGRMPKYLNPDGNGYEQLEFDF